MKYKEWLLWLRTMPWYRKWFVYLILFRPIIDNFYFLKKISPFLSPLYLIGVLTPLLVVLSLPRMKRPVQNLSSDKNFTFFLICAIFSGLSIIAGDISSLTIYAIVIKTIIPVFLFIYVRRFVISEKEIEGILQTLRYASISIIAMFLIELIYKPFGYQETRENLERIQGLYADVSNYGMYFSMIFLANCYFFIKYPTTFKTIRNLAIITILFVLLLTRIHHAATYFVFIALFILFFFMNFRVKPAYGILFILIFSLFFIFYFNTMMEQSVEPLFQRDIEALKGEREESQLLHGRYGRWQMIFGKWVDMPVYAKFLGVPTLFNSKFEWLYGQSGTHNDFVRILMYSGLIGLITYAMFLLNIFRRISKLRLEHRFLGYGGFIILFLYSISLTPMMYAYVMYIILSIFAFVSLPIYKHAKKN